VAAIAAHGKQEFGDAAEVVIDLEGVAQVDSAALSLLFEWQREALRRNMKISFRKLPPSLHSLAKLYGVSELVVSNDPT
jgi:phospholipid transport system transporter-binding protein